MAKTSYTLYRPSTNDYCICCVNSMQRQKVTSAPNFGIFGGTFTDFFPNEKTYKSEVSLMWHQLNDPHICAWFSCTFFSPPAGLTWLQINSCFLYDINSILMVTCASLPQMEELESPVCKAHCTEGSAGYVAALDSACLPNVVLQLKSFSAQVHTLLQTHDGSMPLMR